MEQFKALGPAASKESPSPARDGNLESTLAKPSAFSFSLFLAGAGTVSYIFFTYIACATRDVEYTTAYFQQTDRLSYIWPLSAFATALMMNLLTLAFERGVVKRQLALLACYINILAASSDFINLQNFAHLRQDVMGFTFNVNRQIMWLHTTPIMVYLISIVSDSRPQQVLFVMLADIVMILSAMSAQVSRSYILTGFLATTAACLFCYVMTQMWMMYEGALETVQPESAKGPIKNVRFFTVGLWLIFPAAWVVVHTGILSPVAEEWVWCVGDFIGKIAFSSSLVLSNFLTMDQRRLIAMHAVEATNRLQVIAELKALVEQKERFLSSMTHELRTPLNGIIGLSEAMLVGSCGQLNDTALRTLNTIKNSGLRLLNLINDILDAASMRKGKLVIKCEKVDLRTLVDDVMELCQPLAKKSVKLMNGVSITLPHVLGDTGRIIQIFYNLIGNSCKFTHNGYIAVTANVKSNHIEVNVSDTGIGIPDAKFESIFNEFEQVDMSTTRQYGGTGLGLNLVKQLVAAHNGRVSLSSQLNKGTTFTFTLPVYSTQAAEAAASISDSKAHADFLPDAPSPSPAFTTPSPTPVARRSHDDAAPRSTLIPTPHITLDAAEADSSRPDMQKAISAVASAAGAAVAAASAKDPIKPFYWSKYGKIMVLSVDDDPTNQMVIENLLVPAGYLVNKAMDGEEALKFLQEEPCLPDIVLLDVRMPGMSGYDVCKKLRIMFPDCYIPVIMVSAQTSEEEIVEGLLSGSNDYVTKPFGRQALLARIKSHLQVKHWIYHAASEGEAAAPEGSSVPPTSAKSAAGSSPSHHSGSIQARAAAADSPGAAKAAKAGRRRLLTPASILAPTTRLSLPPSVVARLKSPGSDAIVDRFEHVAVAVVSIRNAKQLGHHVSTEDFLAIYSDLAMQCDALMASHGIYAAPSLDGTIVAVAGLINPQADAAANVKATINYVRDLYKIFNSASLPQNCFFQLSVGIHTGSTVGMVAGLARPHVQLGGTAMYMAASLQQAAPTGCVHISMEAAKLAGDQSSFHPASPCSMLLKVGDWESNPNLSEHLTGFSLDEATVKDSVVAASALSLTPLQQALVLLTQACANSLWDSATLVDAPQEVRQLQAHRTTLEQQLAEVTEEANRLQEALDALEEEMGQNVDAAAVAEAQELVKKIGGLESEVQRVRGEKEEAEQQLSNTLVVLNDTAAQLQTARQQASISWSALARRTTEESCYNASAFPVSGPLPPPRSGPLSAPATPFSGHSAPLSPTSPTTGLHNCPPMQSYATNQYPLPMTQTPSQPPLRLSQYGGVTLEDRIAKLSQHINTALRAASPSDSPRSMDKGGFMVPSYSISASPSRRSSVTTDTDITFNNLFANLRRRPSLRTFLEEVGLPNLVEVFEGEGITLELLPHMADEDLKALGISKVGARVRIKALAKSLANLPEICEEP